MMITKITKDQQVKFNELMLTWRDRASGETDHEACRRIINIFYKDLKCKKPIIFHFTSPFLAIVAAKFLGSQLRSQLGSQLRSQLDSQLRSQLDSQLGSQLYSQLGSQLGSQLYSQLYSQLDSHYSVFWWLLWVCYYEFGKDIGVKFTEETYDRFNCFASNIHSCLPYKKIFIYSHKPIRCFWKGNNLHNEHGMAVEYADGWGWYALNGIPMKKEYVTASPDTLTAAVILAEKDVDVRRELIRKAGVLKIADSGKQIDTWGDYRLIDMRRPLMLNEYAPYLLMRNPSLPETWHLEGVPTECQTVEHALHSTKPPAMQKIPVSDELGQDWYQQGDVMIWPRNAMLLKRYPQILT